MIDAHADLTHVTVPYVATLPGGCLGASTRERRYAEFTIGEWRVHYGLRARFVRGAK